MFGPSSVPKPKYRSRWRTAAGIAYYRLRRRVSWMLGNKRFARLRRDEPLRHVHFTHRTPLLRQLRNVEMQLQYNKIINLRLAVQRIDGLILRPGETFSYWRTIGKPTRRQGYVDGIASRHGPVRSGRRFMSAFQSDLLDDAAHAAYRDGEIPARIRRLSRCGTKAAFRDGGDLLL